MLCLCIEGVMCCVRLSSVCQMYIKCKRILVILCGHCVCVCRKHRVLCAHRKCVVCVSTRHHVEKFTVVIYLRKRYLSAFNYALQKLSPTNLCMNTIILFLLNVHSKKMSMCCEGWHSSCFSVCALILCLCFFFSMCCVGAQLFHIFLMLFPSISPPFGDL